MNELIGKRLIVVGMLATICIGIVIVVKHQSIGEANSFEQQAVIFEQEAIHIGKHFLDAIGYTTGKILFTKLEEKTPNFYWHDLAELERPHIPGLILCWIIRFEQAYRPGHFFKVWIDAYVGEVIGGTQCR